MSRLAFFSPVPPAATGITDYSADVLAILARGHEIEVFHDQPEVDALRLSGLPAFPWDAFEARHAGRPFDLAIHQLGNSTSHAFVYPALERTGGLLVLHDLVLHHARAKTFIDSAAVKAYRADPSSAELREAALASIDRYRAEVALEYPDRPIVADVHLETTGRLLPYAYPLFRTPVRAATVVAAHNDAILAAVSREVSGVPVARLAMPVTRAEVSAADVKALRSRHGIADGELVVGVFGLLTPEKQVDVVARAFGRAVRFGVAARLLLVGQTTDEPWLRGVLRSAGIAARSVVTGRVPLSELPVYIEAADVAVHIRYPTARETSAALLRVLAQGRAAVVSDLCNFAEIPDTVVIRARLTDEEGEVTRAILRLAENPGLGERLGRAAAAYAAAAHSPARCLETYDAAIQLALAEPGRRTGMR